MSDGPDPCGLRNDHASTNIALDAGRRLNGGNTIAQEGGAIALSCEKGCAHLRDGRDVGANFGANQFAVRSPDAAGISNGSGMMAEKAAVDLSRIPEGVRASVASRAGEYDARRLRSQREIIRDVMLSAAECETWLTLGELRALTCYGEASISAQLRHLRKAENGGYDVTKRHREGVSPERPGTDGRGECVWEYRITRGVCVERSRPEELLEAVSA